MRVTDEKLKNLGKKILLTFYPYILIVFGLVFCISIINWILYLHHQDFNFNQDKLYINTTAILSVIILLLLRKRIIFMVVGSIKSRLIYFIILVVLITTPVYYSQIFFEDLTTKVIHLKDISEISEKKLAKFFSVDTYKINPHDLGYYFVAEKERQLKGTHIGWIMDCFFVFPLFSKHYPEPIIWMGMHFHRRTGTGYLHKSDFKYVRFKFLQEIRQKIAKINISNFNYLEILADNEINYGFEIAKKKSSRAYNSREIVLLAHYKPIKNRRLEELNDFIAALVACSFIWFFLNFLIFLRDFDESGTPPLKEVA